MKLPYFKIAEAFDETCNSFTYGSGSNKLASTAKLLSKTVANAGMLAVEIGVEMIQQLPETIGQHAKRQLEQNSHSMTEEQISRAKEAVQYGEENEKRRKAREQN